MNERILLFQPNNKKNKPRFGIASIDIAIEAIRQQLTPDLLKPEYRTNSPHPMFGHCYVASEALWHLTGMKLYIFRGKDQEGITHWWLQDVLGNRFDATADQYTDLGKEPPYHNGRRGCFLTGSEPSKRTKELLSRII